MELRLKLLASAAEVVNGTRQVKVICSTSDVDRMGDIIVQDGIDLGAYKKNPIVLWGHDSDRPIARATDIAVNAGKLRATVTFPDEGVDADADWVYGKIQAGIVNAVSIGFIPREYESLDPKNPWNGYRFTKSELVEFSFVSVPANASCLIIDRSFYKTNADELPSRRAAIETRDNKQEIKDTAKNVVQITLGVEHSPELKALLTLLKSGRVLSAKNQASMEQAMEHMSDANGFHAKATDSHAKAIKCLKDIADQNNPDPNNPADDGDENEEEDTEAARHLASAIVTVRQRRLQLNPA